MEQRSGETLNEVSEKLRREIREEECKLLFEAIPSLRKIIGGRRRGSADDAGQEQKKKKQQHSSRRHSVASQESVDRVEIFSDSGSHRLNYLIKKVISVISSIGDPIVLLIDDIQVSGNECLVFWLSVPCLTLCANFRQWANKTDLDVLKGEYTEVKLSQHLVTHTPDTFAIYCNTNTQQFSRPRRTRSCSSSRADHWRSRTIHF